MNITISRRQFLTALIGVGASVSLSFHIEQATPAQIDEAWEALTSAPWFFDVGEYGTINGSDDKGPGIRSDVYDISTSDIRSIDDLIQEIDQYDELRARFLGLVPDQFHERDWMEWLRKAGAVALPELKAEIDNWLAEDVDWSQMEYWPSGWTGQGKALRFFEQLGREITDAIGVVIVEGDHPGSSYFAAELETDIEDANAATQNLGLPFRFRQEPA
jgi:hypothetical protein